MKAAVTVLVPHFVEKTQKCPGGSQNLHMRLMLDVKGPC